MLPEDLSKQLFSPRMNFRLEQIVTIACAEFFCAGGPIWLLRGPQGNGKQPCEWSERGEGGYVETGGEGRAVSAVES